MRRADGLNDLRIRATGTRGSLIRAGIAALQRVEEGYDLPRFIAEEAHVEEDR